MSDSEPLQFKPAKVSWATSRFVAAMPPAASRVFLYAVVVFAAVGLIYSALSRVSVSVESRGLLTTREQSFPVTSPFTGRVKQLLVKENDHVKAGDVLVVAEDQLDPGDVKLVGSQRTLLESLIQRDARGACPDCVAAYRSLATAAFRLEHRGALRQPLAECRQLLLDLVAAKDREESAHGSSVGARRRIALAEQKLQQIRQRNAEELLGMQVEQLKSEIVAARGELVERKQGAEGQLAQARNALLVRLAELDKHIERNQRDSVVVASGNGIVNELKLSGELQQVQSGQQLMQLLPAESGLVAELFVANKDISQVKPGLAVRLKLDALPEREYGGVDGVVEEIAASTIQGRPQQPDQSSNLAYRVRVKFDRQSLEKDGVDYPFRLGMSLTGVIVTRYETLLWRGLRKIFNLKDQAFGESAPH